MILLLLLVVLFFFSGIEVWKQKKKSKLSFLLLYVLISLIAIVRFGVGADYPGYYNAFQEINSIDINGISELLLINAHGELGYLFLVYLFGKLGLTFYELAILIAIITMPLYYIFLKKYCNYSILSLFIFYAIYFVVYPFNVIRQGLTIALFLGVLLPLLFEKKYLLYVIYTVLGSLFHYSLLTVLILPFILKFKFKIGTIYIFIILGLIFPMGNLIMNIGFLNSINVLSYYLDDSSNVYAFLNRAVFVIPSFYYYAKSDKNSVEKKMALISIIGFLIFINFRSYSLIASRTTVYFKVVEIYLLAKYISDIKLLPNKMLVFNLFSIFLFIIFIKAMNTDITYLKHFGNIPEYESIINYPIYNNYFHPM
ncbi:EpsG family protein [Bacteroides nordii]|uniref:EpsG family protein n=1 Tax=Bacteroides nordii TaxID=291645 RepID=UPI0034A4A9AC